MSKRKYTHVQELLPEILEMIAGRKTQREVADIWGLQDKYVVKSLLKRERNKMWKIESGIVSRPKGRPRKDLFPEILSPCCNMKLTVLKWRTNSCRIF